MAERRCSCPPGRARLAAVVRRRSRPVPHSSRIAVRCRPASHPVLPRRQWPTIQPASGKAIDPPAPPATRQNGPHSPVWPSSTGASTPAALMCSWATRGRGAAPSGRVLRPRLRLAYAPGRATPRNPGKLPARFAPGRAVNAWPLLPPSTPDPVPVATSAGLPHRRAFEVPT